MMRKTIYYVEEGNSKDQVLSINKMYLYRGFVKGKVNVAMFIFLFYAHLVEIEGVQSINYEKYVLSHRT